MYSWLEVATGLAVGLMLFGVVTHPVVALRSRLRGQQREGAQAQTELLAQGSVLRGELSAAQLERTRLEGEISTLRENNQSLDLFNVRLNSQYQVRTHPQTHNTRKH